MTRREAPVWVAVVGTDGVLCGDGAEAGAARSRTGAIRAARDAGWRVWGREAFQDHLGEWIVSVRGRRR